MGGQQRGGRTQKGHANCRGVGAGQEQAPLWQGWAGVGAASKGGSKVGICCAHNIGTPGTGRTSH